MKIEEFVLERYQSLWENRVDINLTESGIHPYTLRELLSEEDLNELMDLRLVYGWTNGMPDLRESISALYPGTTPDNVLVTNGSGEANFASMWTMLEPGDEIVLMLPNYMQIHGICESMGATVRPFTLKEELAWAPDPDELKGLVNGKTRAIVICNPNNPTGAVLSEENVEAITNVARENDVWLYVDEVYRGAEIDGKEGASFHGRYEKTILVSGLSKALAHPGLRIGWVVGPRDFVDQVWSRTDYTTITTGVLSQYVANKILGTGLREEILRRNRGILIENVGFLMNWMETREDLLSFHPPQAGAMAFIRYAMDINSTEFCERLRKEKSVLVVAGDCYGMDRFIRIGLGSERAEFEEGMNRVASLLEEMR